MSYKIIVAVDQNLGIGKEGKIPWHCPEDLANFKRLTTGGIVIMGRKTWESLPKKVRPLPGRDNYVLSRDQEFTANGAHVFHRIVDLVEHLQSETRDKWVIGGAEIYEQFLENDVVDEVRLTSIPGDYQCDASFRRALLSMGRFYWDTESSSIPIAGNALKATIEVYRKRK